MKCKDRALLQKFLDNELNNNLTQLVITHLNHCRECQDTLANIKKDVSTIKNLFEEATDGITTVPPFDYSKINSKIKTEPLKYKIITIAAAASLILFLGWIGMSVFNQDGPDKKSNYNTVEKQDFNRYNPNKLWQERQLFIVLEPRGVYKNIIKIITSNNAANVVSEKYTKPPDENGDKI